MTRVNIEAMQAAKLRRAHDVAWETVRDSIERVWAGAVSL